METLSITAFHDRQSRLAKSLESAYFEYTTESGVMNITLKDGRQQSVKSLLREGEKGSFVVFMSKVCYAEEYSEINFMEMLEYSRRLNRSKIVADQGYLEVEASANLDTNSDEDLLSLIMEVAQAADSLELQITGYDMY